MNTLTLNNDTIKRNPNYFRKNLSLSNKTQPFIKIVYDYKEQRDNIDVIENNLATESSPIKNYIKSNTILQDYIVISGEHFYIEKEDNLIYLTHPRWSLLGVGETLYEAHANLILEAKSLLKSFKNLPVETLSQDALNLRDFLFKVA